MLLTFTRRAAREMVGRTRSLLAEQAADITGSSQSRAAGRVVGGTFHSVAHRTLRAHAASLGLAEGFSVLDAADAADLVDLVRQDLAVEPRTGRRFPRKATLLDLYSRSVNTGRPLREVIEDVAPWCGDQIEPIAEICRGYVARKRSLGLLDFDDLLLYWRAAASDERLGPLLAGQFDHVCVDEYQDVNALQVDVLAALRSEDRRLTVVGDDSQAVYGFRGASPRHLLDVADTFPGISTVLLEDNYRSSQPILDVANAIGAEAPEGFSTRLRSRVTTGPTAAAGPVRRRGRAGRRRVRADPGAPRRGRRTARAGRAGPRRPSQRPARARAVPPAHPVREVRRPALPRGRPRQGPDLPVPPGRQPPRRARLVPSPPAHRGRRPDPRPPRDRGARPVPAGHGGRGAAALAARASNSCRCRHEQMPITWSRRWSRSRANRSRRTPSGCVRRSCRWSNATTTTASRGSPISTRWWRAPATSPACPTSRPTSRSNRRTPPVTSPVRR